MDRIIPVTGIVLILSAPAPISAQPQEGVDILLGKARSLEARGRIDLAAQTWNQVLLVNPNQTEALAGLARYAKETGDREGERRFLDRLRKINPNHPAIAAIEKMRVITPDERNRLDEAGRLAMQHKPDEAMKIYRAIFGDAPPPGKWAEAFYETQAASTGGRARTIAQLRELCARDPDNEVYRLWLGRVLTYDAKTRAEGFQLLQTVRDSGPVEQARAAWRQALLWERENPAVHDPLEAYLQRYQDPELEKIAASLRERRQQAISEADERRGFQALSSRDAATAEAKFESVLRRAPANANAIAGLGFVRLQQRRFDDAVRLFERARGLAPDRADIRDGQETARFWLAMQRADALQAGRPSEAVAAYEAAAAIRPLDDQPVLAIAQIRLRQGNLADAAGRFEQVIKRSPGNADAIAGLAFVRLNEKNFGDAAALFEQARRLAPDRADVEEGYRAARFWDFMRKGAAALEENRPEAAISSYQAALALKPQDRDALRGLAGAAARKGSHGDAIGAYGRLASTDPGDVSSWLGLMRTQIAANQPGVMLETSRRIPPAIQQELEARSDYLAELSLANYQLNQVDAGDRMLLRAIAAASRSDSAEGVAARLRVAGLLVNKGRFEVAIPVYRQATVLHPEDAMAWQGLVGAYAAQRDVARALATLRSMPRTVYEAAAVDAGFLSTAGAVYAADGQCGEAERLLARSLEVDRAAGRQLTESTHLQLADIWMREGRYDRASQAYGEIVAANANSADAWRGYITALHNDRHDEIVAAEAGRMPSGPRTELDKDPAFLVLLAGAHSTVGERGRAVELLQRARAEYLSRGTMGPPDLDVQLGWAMLAAPDDGDALAEHLAATKSRPDLTPRQRDAIDAIAAIWSLDRAEKALQGGDSGRAVAILAEAQRDQPQNPKLRAALASAYARQNDYPQALAVYRSWGMEGAEAADFRSAAGAALASGDQVLAERFLFEGRERFPSDPGLLHMSAQQLISQGSYAEAERYLRRALEAAAHPPPSVVSGFSRTGEPPPSVVSGFGRTGEPPPSVVSGFSRTGEPPLSVVSGFSRTGEPSRSIEQTEVIGPPAVNACRDMPAVVADTATPNPPNAAADDAVARSDAKGDSSQVRPDRIQDEIDLLAHRNTPFIGIGGPLTIRAGDPGINRLIVADGTASGSITVSNSVRLSAEAHAVSLDSGVSDGRSGYRFGTLPPGARFREQTAEGLGGELQVSTSVFGLAVGASPRGFPVQTFTGGLRIGKADGPVMLMAARENVKDSLLSYAGALDPGTGAIWGGVMSNSVALHLKHDAGGSGQYAIASGALLRGENVADNWNVQGILGAYWRVLTVGDGGLSVGLNAVGIHYDKNLNFFSLGHGGYFSPQRYLLGSIPISWRDRQRRVEYEINGSAGVQYIQEYAAPLNPTGLSTSPLFYAATEREGLNYSTAARVDYRIGEHWALGIFASANNARDYDSRSVGVSLKLLANRLPATTGIRLKAVPDWRGRQPYNF